MSTFRDAVCSGGACLRPNIVYNDKLDRSKLRHYNHKLPKVDTSEVTPTILKSIMRNYPEMVIAI
ncbi:MAG: hypothetical protein FWG98_06970 [Candidatus Cloacimonetes bacterium]|nr:hypothetical protein [Candidatus Cloacimonadota bacterium]